MLQITNLHVQSEGKEILKGIDLIVQTGEIHALMGPNGSGKSTLASVLVGHPDFEITEGDILFDGKSLKDMDPEKRSKAGLFLGFQHPVEIPGVTSTSFLKTIVNEKRKTNDEEPLDALQFNKVLKEKAEELNVPQELLERPLNDGFSGGEKKRLEILQMALLDPKLKILDEIDSGLDIDALKDVSAGIKQLHTPETATLLITHYQRLLKYFEVDRVHVLVDGRIVESGGKELAGQIEENGYDELIPQERPKLNVLS